MESNMELVAVTSQKHDPAWKHCQMFKNGDNKVHLKCIYCGKIFKGGGIHRIKEHLAGQKGNAATCLRVQPDVRLQMLESLNGVAAKKRKKHNFEDDIGYDNPSTSRTELLDSTCGLRAELDLIPVPEMIEHDIDVYGHREDVVLNSTGATKKKRKVRKAASDVVNSNALPLTSFQPANSKRVSNTVHMAIGRFFFDVGLPMEAANSAYFQPMVDAIASHGPGTVAPSYHDLRSSILKNLVYETRNDVDKCVETWGRTGCSILVDEWNSGKGKTFVNFLVYCPEGTIFLRSSDISHIIDSMDDLYELLRVVVEEVGERNVLQVITSSEDRYVIAGKRLTDTYPNIFWTPCAGNCVDLILEEIGGLARVKMILEQAKSVSRYIYTNKDVLNMMRRYTYGVDLLDLGISKSSTDFLTLQRMVNIKHNLQAMVTSEEWMESPYSKQSEGFAILDYISNQSFWSTCALITRIIDPLLRLLRIIGSAKKPAMGYIYAGLYRAKETIKKELVIDEEYLVYWNIIDRRWEQLLRHPLHAAGFYFNPKFFYSLDGDAHLHTRSLVYDCIEKLVPDPIIQDKIMKETASYHGGAGDFGRKMAVRARDTLLPTEWWLTYGGGCPNLARMAIRILSQTCGLIQHKFNRVFLEQMHEKRNRVENQRLRDLVYTQYNMSLKQMVPVGKIQKAVDPIAVDNIDLVEEWVVEKELGADGSGNADWMVVNPPVGNIMLLGQPLDDIEALGAGFNDYEIFDAVKDGEDESLQ